MEKLKTRGPRYEYTCVRSVKNSADVGLLRFRLPHHIGLRRLKRASTVPVVGLRGIDVHAHCLRANVSCTQPLAAPAERCCAVITLHEDEHRSCRRCEMAIRRQRSGVRSMRYLAHHRGFSAAHYWCLANHFFAVLVRHVVWLNFSVTAAHRNLAKLNFADQRDACCRK